MRPEWDDYFLAMAVAVARRADCRRRKVGAVIVSSDHRVLATGYNGGRPGVPGCLDGTCPRGRLSYEAVAQFQDYSTPGTPGYCTSTHAEMNAMLYAGTSVVGATIYVTCPPCPACKKAIFNAGLSKYVYTDSTDFIAAITCHLEGELRGYTP